MKCQICNGTGYWQNHDTMSMDKCGSCNGTGNIECPDCKQKDQQIEELQNFIQDINKYLPFKFHKKVKSLLPKKEVQE